MVFRFTKIREKIVYVADTSNSTIREIRGVGTSNVVTTIAGMAGVNGSADGMGTNVQFKRRFWSKCARLTRRGNIWWGRRADV